MVHFARQFARRNTITSSSLLFALAISVVCSQSTFAQGQLQPRNNGGVKPAAQPVQKVDPALMRVLQNWEASSKKIQSLEGEHQRIVYDDVFFTAKSSRGRFFYKHPDQGRIDLLGVKGLKPGTSTTIKDPKTGKEKKYKVQSDLPERWICDGQSIYQINETEKTIDSFELPKEARGQNIINGPLPFLFGMPAEDALKRFRMNLMGVDANGRFWIEAFPRWRQDAASYRSAEIILDNKTYLPTAVRLFDPAGTKTTTFIFSNLRPNKGGNWISQFFGRDPFAIPQRGYQIVKKKPTERVPGVVGMYWKDAAKVLEKAGYVVNYKKGNSATNKNLTYVVYHQKPGRLAQHPKGTKVDVTVYLPPPGGAKPVQNAKRPNGNVNN